MGEEKTQSKIHYYLDSIFRILFLIAAIIFIIILIFIILCSSASISVIGLITSLIFLFSILGGFFDKMETIKTPFGSAKLKKEKAKEEKTKSELGTHTTKLLLKTYQNPSEDFPLEPAEGIIDALNLTTDDLKKIQEYKKLLEEINNV